MATGISGLYKGTMGAIAHNKAKYQKEIQALAKRWNIGLERAYETIMKRIDKGLPPLPDCVAKNKPKAKRQAVQPAAKATAKAVASKPAKSTAKAAASHAADMDVLNEAAAYPETVGSVEKAKETLEKCIAGEIFYAVAGSHYDLPYAVKESIELIEQLMDRATIPARPKFMIGQALRYIIRCGIKTPDWGKDIGKAENYLHRALTGRWNTGK